MALPTTALFDYPTVEAVGHYIAASRVRITVIEFMLSRRSSLHTRSSLSSQSCDPTTHRRLQSWGFQMLCSLHDTRHAPIVTVRKNGFAFRFEVCSSGFLELS